MRRARRAVPQALALVLAFALGATATRPAAVADESSRPPRTASAPAPFVAPTADPQVAVPALTRRAGGPAAPAREARARSQSAPGPAPMEITLRSPIVRWRTAPFTAVDAELLRDGQVVAQGSGFAEDDGAVVVYFFPRGDEPEGGGYETVVLPGDTVVLTPAGSDESTRATVPAPFAVDVDAEADRVVARLPAGTDATVSLLGAGGAVERRVAAGADGSLELALAGAFDLRPGDTGRLLVESAEGHRFAARFAALRVDVRLGGMYPEAVATLGTTVTLEIAAPDGRRKGRLSGRAGGGFEVSTRERFGLYGEITQTIAAGDVLTMTQEGGLLPSAPVVVTAPALEVAIETATGRVVGQGPPGTALDLELVGPLGDARALAATADADGGFEAPVGADVGAGWRARLWWPGPGGLYVGALGVVPQAQVGVHTVTVRGFAAPGRAVTVTLRDGAGAGPGAWSSPAGDDGVFRVDLVTFDPLRGDATPQVIRPGQSLEITLVEGDPIVVGVPDLSARTDPDAERVSGDAPPGSRLRLVVLDREAPGPFDGPSSRVAARAETQADAAGAWTVDVGALRDDAGRPLDIEPPMAGTVSLVRPDGHELFVGWAPIGIEAQLGSSFVNGNGPPGRAVDVTLRAVDGAVVGATGARDSGGDVFGDEPFWYALLTDEIGQMVPMATGDVLHVRIGDDAATLTLPALEGVIHVTDDLVTGRATPGVTLTVAVFTFAGGQAVADVRVAEDGTFAVDFGAEGIDLQFNDPIYLSQRIGRHGVTRFVNGPGLTLQKADGTVTGAAEPGKEATLRLERGGTILASRTFVAPPSAAFTTVLTDGRGERIVPRAGDRIVLDVPTASTTDRAIVMDVPDLSIDYDVAANTVGGRVTPGSRLEFSAWPIYPFGPFGWGGDARVEIGPDGRYVVTFGNPDFALTPGIWLGAFVQLPSGHRVIDRRVVPIASVQLGGANVCGWADGGAPVSATRLEGARATASDAATAGPNGRYRLALDGPGGPPDLGAGDVVRVDLGQGASTVTLPELSVRPDWATGVVSGTTAPGAQVFLSMPSTSCAPNEALYEPIAFAATTTADEAGVFALDVPVSAWSGLSPRASGIEVSVGTPSGHRAFRIVRPVRIEALVDTPRVRGHALPGAALTVRLADAAGAQRAAAQVVADGLGAYAVDLRGADGRAATLRAGDRLVVVAAGEEAAMTVAKLSFDFSRDRGLVGQTEPGARVAFEATLVPSPVRDSQAIAFALTADAAGRFALAAAPRRSPWTFDELRALRASIPTADDHATLSELFLEGDGRAGGRILLPIARR